MKRDILDRNAEQITSIKKINRRNAFHEAGYAAAIHLGNQGKKLPPVHFQISIKPKIQDKRPFKHLEEDSLDIYGKYIVKVEGGRLIQILPLCFSKSLQNLNWYQQAEYGCAFEADMINLLVGSLAEAKYIALRDGETFSITLINFNALRFYSGSADLELANKYLECYLPDEDVRKHKLAELFLAAFRFVDDKNNWRKIFKLAGFIQDQTKTGIIHCEEAISILDTGAPLNKAISLDLQTMRYG